MTGVKKFLPVGALLVCAFSDEWWLGMGDKTSHSVKRENFSNGRDLCGPLICVLSHVGPKFSRHNGGRRWKKRSTTREENVSAGEKVKVNSMMRTLKGKKKKEKTKNKKKKMETNKRHKEKSKRENKEKKEVNWWVSEKGKERQVTPATGDSEEVEIHAHSLFSVSPQSFLVSSLASKFAIGKKGNPLCFFLRLQVQ